MGAIRPLAGFAPDSNKSFNIPRDTLEPPEALTAAVFPSVDRWVALHDDVNNTEVDKSVTGKATLRMLQYLRRVLIQDSVFLRERWPHLVIWDDPIFKRPDYIAYASDLRVASAAPEVLHPSRALIHPAVQERLDGMERTVLQILADVQHHQQTKAASADSTEAIMILVARVLRKLEGGINIASRISFDGESAVSVPDGSRSNANRKSSDGELSCFYQTYNF